MAVEPQGQRALSRETNRLMARYLQVWDSLPEDDFPWAVETLLIDELQRIVDAEDHPLFFVGLCDRLPAILLVSDSTLTVLQVDERGLRMTHLSRSRITAVQEEVRAHRGGIDRQVILRELGPAGGPFVISAGEASGREEVLRSVLSKSE